RTSRAASTPRQPGRSSDRAAPGKSLESQHAPGAQSDRAIRRAAGKIRGDAEQEEGTAGARGSEVIVSPRGGEGGAMGFYEVLDRVVALLRERGRVTYRGLKREFQLDEACLEDLKDELINAQRLAVDEGAAMLVWTGTPAAGIGQQAEAERRLH